MTKQNHVKRVERRGEGGDTLVEVLMSLLILSITVVSLLVAFSTAFASSAEHRNLAVTDTVLRSVAEQVYSAFQQTSSPVFAACGSTTPVPVTTYYNSMLTQALTPPSPYASTYSASITSVYYWSGSNFSLTSSTCTTGTTVPQELTVQVLGPQGQSESVALVMSGSGQIIVAPSVQLNTPSVTSVTAPASTIGGLTIAYSGSSNAPSGQTYTAKACTDASMSVHCASYASYLSGTNILGLIPGTMYYVTVTADASTGYIYATSSVSSAVASGSSTTPTVTSVAPSTSTAGSVVVNFAGLTNPPGGQTYMATACTDSAMSLNCVNATSFTSGSMVDGLDPASRYYVTVTANVNGSTPATTSIVSSPAELATSQLAVPNSVVATSSMSAAGVIDVSFNSPSNAPANQLYSAEACTNNSMSIGCVTVNLFTTGSQISGLTAGISYYVTITAKASSGYLVSTSNVSSGVKATIGLIAPSISSTSSATTGTASISFAGSSNAPTGQTYAANVCTSSTMTSGCSTVNPYSSGASITGLTSGATYYVTITANGSLGYLAATSSVKSVSVN